MGSANLNAWLVRQSGLLTGTRHALQAEITRIGRAPDNDIVIGEAAMVSSHHLEIRKDAENYQLVDLNSTNGTYLNGERVTEGQLAAPSAIRLGADGPEFSFVVDDYVPQDLNQTLVVPAAPIEEPKKEIVEPTKPHEDLLSEAVARARVARRTGAGDSTVVIMREMLDAALHRTGRKFKAIIAGLVCALVATSAFGYWKIQGLKTEKQQYDGRIHQIEAALAQGAGDLAQADQLYDELDEKSREAEAVQKTLLYRVGSSFDREEFVEREIKALLKEFGAETYSVPPEFVSEVKRFIEQYQDADRAHMERALGAARKNMNTMREIFAESNLPPDLVYMVLVESALSRDSESAAGAVGLWQFTPATARAYGLKVTDDVDERSNPAKSTRAACKYIRDLILDFGSGSSVMLALAAYNLGPSRVKTAIRKVNDPIKQRNFWYLYRVRAVPPETREYVPKVIAAMIIARHPERYGF